MAPLDALTTNNDNTLVAKCVKMLTKQKMELIFCNYNPSLCQWHTKDKVLMLNAVVNVVVKMDPNVVPVALVKLS